MNKAISRVSTLLAVSGIAAIAFGVALFVWPEISLAALLALFGGFSLLYGTLVLGMGLYLVAHRSTDWVPFTLSGLAALAIGVSTYLFPGITALSLVYLIAGWAIVVGVFEVVAAIDMREAVRDAWWLGLSGALSVVFGVVIGVFPGTGVLTILWLIGTYSIAAGIPRIVAAYRLRKLSSSVESTAGAMRSAVGSIRT